MALNNVMNAHNRWFILFHHVWQWDDLHWKNIWLRAWPHMTSHYTWGSVTTRHEFGGVLGQWPFDTFFWVLTISWSQLLAHVWSGPLENFRSCSEKALNTPGPSGHNLGEISYFLRRLSWNLECGIGPLSRPKTSYYPLELLMIDLTIGWVVTHEF